MQAMVFDGIAREIGEVSTRRSFVRLLGGAAALSAGLAITARDESLGKGKNRGKSRSQDQVSAQGSGKKVTICYQNQTRQVKKKGWRQKYPGATLGKCSNNSEQSVCRSWILSGGPSVSTPIVVDDDLQVMLNGVVLGNDGNGQASTLTPLTFAAEVGDSLGIIARDAQASCRSLSPLWLHCATSGQKRQLFAGNNDGCAPGRTPGTFFSEVYTVSL
jgi:hypothetical protein